MSKNKKLFESVVEAPAVALDNTIEITKGVASSLPTTKTIEENTKKTYKRTKDY